MTPETCSRRVTSASGSPSVHSSQSSTATGSSSTTPGGTCTSSPGIRGVVATTSLGGSDGATYLTLVTKNGNNGLTNSAQLGVWSHHKVYYKGIGVDKAKIQDWRDGGRELVTNVFVIPTGAVIDQK